MIKNDAPMQQTNESIVKCLDAIQNSVFLACSLMLQKHYMCRHMQKPRSMTTCKWITWLYELNNYLSYFPGESLTKLEDNDMKEIVKDGIPQDWQMQMTIQNFNVTEKSIPKFINFCKCLETLEDAKGNDKLTKSPTEDKGKHKHKNDQTKSEDSKEKYCILHGHGNHTSNDYREWMVKKHKRSNNTNYIKDSKKDYKPKQSKVNAMVVDAVKAIKSKKSEDRKKVQAELNAFKDITISDTDEFNMTLNWIIQKKS